MSKAARIRELYAQGKTCKEIAGIIGCKVEYARICAQQRGTKAAGPSASSADAKYLMRKYGGKTLQEAQMLKQRQRMADPAFRKIQSARVLASYHRRKALAQQPESCS